MKILNFLNGKKTFIIGVCAIVYGIKMKDPNAILIGSGMIGVRQGIYKLEQKVLAALLPNAVNAAVPEN